MLVLVELGGRISWRGWKTCSERVVGGDQGFVRRHGGEEDVSPESRTYF